MTPLTNLVDAAQMARVHPDTFSVPDGRSIVALKPGDFVKVCRNDERFWVELTEVSGGWLVGKVANQLFVDLNPDLGLGDPVCVRPCHVFDIEWKRP